MDFQHAKLHLTVKEALAVLAGILIVLGTGIIYFEMNPHVPVLTVLIGLLLYGRLKGLSFSEMEKAMAQGAFSGLGAVYIFFFIGLLISAWMASGTIPTIMYYGFSILSGQAFYAVVFLMTSLLGLVIGSSLTTAATVGVAFIGMAQGLDLSLSITAGAIVSGAFLGDKMSPLSDTSNLASETVGVPLFVHLKNMLWTTIPGFFLSILIFYWLSPERAPKSSQIEGLIETLKDQTFISLWSLLPFLIVAVLAVKKLPAVIVIAAGIGSSLAVAFAGTPGLTVVQMGEYLYSGYTIESGSDTLDTILSRGGLSSMMFSISLVIAALGMGGLLFCLGIIPSLFEALKSKMTSAGRLVTACTAAGAGVNLLVGEQYLSILLPGKSFQASFEAAGIAPKSLSRVLEDAGTVVNPLIPWGVCGVYLTQVLGVPVLDYLPFAFFCLLCPLLTLASGWTKIGLHFKTETAKTE